MGHVFDAREAAHYMDWSQSEQGRYAMEIEKELLLELWSPLSAQQVLEVGCGVGLFLEWFANMGHQVTGLDPSPDTLRLARSRVPDRVALDRGFAEDLPYPADSFDTVALITALEFVNDPAKAVEEACRVARKHVLLGALNKYSLMTCKHLIERLWKKSSVYRHARFFSIMDLHRFVETALSGPVPLHWRTCLTLPPGTMKYFRHIESSSYFRWNPFGHFMGMRVDLRYNLQTIQEPLLTKVLSGAAADRCHVSTWQSLRGKNDP